MGLPAASFWAALSTRTTRATRRPSVHRHGCPRSRARACHCEDIHVVMPALQIIFFSSAHGCSCVCCVDASGTPGDTHDAGQDFSKRVVTKRVVIVRPGSLCICCIATLIVAIDCSSHCVLPSQIDIVI